MVVRFLGFLSGHPATPTLKKSAAKSLFLPVKGSRKDKPIKKENFVAKTLNNANCHNSPNMQ